MDEIYIDEPRTCWEYFVTSMTKKYCYFSGRARPKEYWGTCLYYALIMLLLFVLAQGMLFSAITQKDPQMTAVMEYIRYLPDIFGFGFLMPLLAVTVRRLHDADMSGWWILTVFIVFAVPFFDTDRRENKYGPIPAGVDGTQPKGPANRVW